MLIVIYKKMCLDSGIHSVSYIRIYLCVPCFHDFIVYLISIRNPQVLLEASGLHILQNLVFPYKPGVSHQGNMQDTGPQGPWLGTTVNYGLDYMDITYQNEIIFLIWVLLKFTVLCFYHIRTSNKDVCYKPSLCFTFILF